MQQIERPGGNKLKRRLKLQRENWSYICKHRRKDQLGYHHREGSGSSPKAVKWRNIMESTDQLAK
ncbi:MAG: hypothetical protein Q7J31_09780, partial [Syntrophales bacterium]|nr:hypothetical protein [Syntrophales bacterium]